MQIPIFLTQTRGFVLNESNPVLITKTVASVALSLVVNGISMQANLLHGNVSGCEMSAATAKQWRALGAIVTEQQIGAWCVVGKVADGFWHAEQWEAARTSSQRSRGWQVRIPLSAHKTGWYAPSRVGSSWALDVFDPEINARFRYRQSYLSPDAHHKKSLSLAQRHSIVMTRPHPDGGSFSVAIDRGGSR